MNVLSLFDGISAGQVAFQRAGIPVTKYYASEIDKFAIQVTQNNFPNTIQLGDVTKWREWGIDWSSIDILIAGSPCQGFSRAGNRLNFEDPRSKLFFEFVNILNHIGKFNPDVLFLLENVNMDKEWKYLINDLIGVSYVCINSSLVSAQLRDRLYWTNINKGFIPLPDDKKILLKDIIEHGFVDRDKSYCIDANYWKGVPSIEHYKKKSVRQIVYKKPHGGNKGGLQERDKFHALRIATNGNYIILDTNTWRKLTPVECERLQNFNDNYTEGISNTQRYKALGNSWTVDVIAHIFSFITNPVEEQLFIEY